MEGSNIVLIFHFLDRINPQDFSQCLKEFVLYSLELQMAGVILLTAMAIGGISLWIKRRRERHELESTEK